MKIRGVRPIFSYALLIILWVWGFAHAVGNLCQTPLLTHTDTSDQREFSNVYQCTNSPNISTGTAQYFRIQPDGGSIFRPFNIGSGDVAGIGFEPTPNVSGYAGTIRFGDNSGWMFNFGRSRETVGGSLDYGSVGILAQITDNGNWNFKIPVQISSGITFTSGIQFPSLTLAGLQTNTPSSAGIAYYCSNCSVDAECISTGTAQGAFARVTARTTACQ